jgi:hypothetical protein
VLPFAAGAEDVKALRQALGLGERRAAEVGLWQTLSWKPLGFLGAQTTEHVEILWEPHGIW